MNLIILGGNAPHNQQWIQEIAETVGQLFDKVLVWEYEHWHGGQPFIDFTHEQQQLQPVAKSYEPYVVIAKSVGVLLTSKGLGGKTQPAAHGYIFLGTPLKLVQREHWPLGEQLRRLKGVDIIFVQNSNDPAGSADELKAFLEDETVTAYRIETPQAASHSYPDMGLLTELASHFTA